MLQFYIKLFGKKRPLQTHLSNLVAVTQKQSVRFVYFYLLWYVFNIVKRTYFYPVSLKRKRALPEGNLPAIRLMLIR
jgi:hypothetical protein